MLKRKFLAVPFALAAALLVGSVASADAPVPKAPAPAIASEFEALLYLQQARLSIVAAEDELRVQGDTSESLVYTLEAFAALRSAAVVIQQLPPTAAPGR